MLQIGSVGGLYSVAVQAAQTYMLNIIPLAEGMSLYDTAAITADAN